MAVAATLLAALVACGGGGSSATGTDPGTPVTGPPAGSITASPPAVPRAGLAAADLVLVVAQGDALSEAAAQAYQRARGLGAAQVMRLPVPTDRDVISAADFQKLKAEIDARLPDSAQATLLTFARPSRVQGPTCTMSITSAMAFGYDAAWCGGCASTKASPYFDSETTRPWADLKIRPSMMLGPSTLAGAEALIARGVAADGTAPRGTGWLVRTADAARNVRFPDWTGLPALWGGGSEPLLSLRYVDAAANPAAQLVQQQPDLLFYFTGLAAVDGIATNTWLPGAVADHLTSSAGVLPDGIGQMPVTAWLAAGATASYGTVEEPCNRTEKFPKVSVLLNHYLRGATVLEAYWKSVQRPGQGLFVGEPLARPWTDAPSASIEGGQLLLRTRNWRRDAVYTVQGRMGEAGAWQTLATRQSDGPRLDTWRTTLPPGTSALRVRGPCATAPALTCTWGTDD